MFHYNDQNNQDLQELAALGSDVVAYMRQITTEEIRAAFSDALSMEPELEEGQNYWALFGADGSPLVLALTQQDVSSSAFYNNLEAVLPN